MHENRISSFSSGRRDPMKTRAQWPIRLVMIVLPALSILNLPSGKPGLGYEYDEKFVVRRKRLA